MAVLQKDLPTCTCVLVGCLPIEIHRSYIRIIFYFLDVASRASEILFHPRMRCLRFASQQERAVPGDT